MTRRKPLQRTVALLLCVFLCLGAAFSMMGAAYAADLEPPASGVTIEIMLPSDWASTSAAAKVCITDQTGGGFASAEVRIDRGGSWRNITASLEQREDRYYGVVDMSVSPAMTEKCMRTPAIWSASTGPRPPCGPASAGTSCGWRPATTSPV